MRWRDLLWGLRELLYPGDGRCPFCRRELGTQDVICTNCLNLVREWRKHYSPCSVCGRLLPQPGLCRDCRQERPPFRWARAAGPYEGLLRDAIHRLKYGGRRRLSRPLAYLLHLSLDTSDLPGRRPNVDLLVPVPLHPRRLAQRSFNQAALLAHELSLLSNIPVVFDALIRARETPSQVGLSRTERLVNLAGAFVANNKAPVADRAVLLVDDTFTTGATVRECSRTLLAAGARAVYVVTVATAKALP